MCAQQHSIQIKTKHSQQPFLTGMVGHVFRLPLAFILKWLLVSLLTLLIGCAHLSERNDDERESESHRDSLAFEIKGLPVPGPFSIERIELHTLKRTTVFNRSQELRPVATIQYKGAGTIVGHWTIDGRILEPFYVSLNRGSTVSLKLENQINLSALSSGRHYLSIKLNQPHLNFNAPKFEFYLE